MINTKNNFIYSRSYQISLFLIALSFIFLVLFSYNALKSQDRLAQGKTIQGKLLQLDKISSGYFSKLAKQTIPQWAISMPMDKPIYPLIRVPSDIFSQEKLWRFTASKNSDPLPLIQGEAHANSSEKLFWRFKLLQLYIKQKEFLLAREQANKIIESNLDFLLPNKNSIKYKSILMCVNSLMQNNSPEAAVKWAYKLRNLPIPTKLPSNVGQLIRKASGKLKLWLHFLIWCFSNSYNADLKPGWYDNGGSLILLVASKNGLVAYPGDKIIIDLISVINKNGLSDLALDFNLQASNANHLLQNSTGLYIKIPKLNYFKVKTSFFWLVILTSIGILALFKFSIFEWKYIQREQSIQDEEEFLRQTAHDLKTPLTSIQFLAETISLKRYKSPEKEQEYLDSLINETNRAAIIIDQMLYSVRLARRVIKPNIVSFNPASELNYILTRFKPRLVDWTIKAQDTANCKILADKDMWERVFINLIENAIKHATKGKVIDFSITALDNDKDIIEISVGDRGPGISIAKESEDVSLLTGNLPYDKSRGGSGVGLHLIRQIMQLHSGKFMCRLRKGGGLLFKTQWKRTSQEQEI